jgi:hypothetical protein
MSFAWSADIAGSDEVARGIAVLQRNAAYDAEIWARTIATARTIARDCAPMPEWSLIGRVRNQARVSESLASNAVWQLCDEGMLDQDWDTSELTLAR